jgi:hypothetical protein
MEIIINIPAYPVWNTVYKFTNYKHGAGAEFQGYIKKTIINKI